MYPSPFGGVTSVWEAFPRSLGSVLPTSGNACAAVSSVSRGPRWLDGTADRAIKRAVGPGRPAFSHLGMSQASFPSAASAPRLREGGTPTPFPTVSPEGQPQRKTLLAMPRPHPTGGVDRNRDSRPAPYPIGKVGLSPHLYLRGGVGVGHGSYLVDPASSHMLVSKIKPCMSKYKQLVQ